MTAHGWPWVHGLVHGLGAQVTQSARPQLCLPCRPARPRGQLSAPRGLRAAGARVLWAHFAPSQYFLPACPAREKASQASEADCGGAAVERIRSSRRGGHHPYSLSLRPRPGGRRPHVCERAALREHRASRYRVAPVGVPAGGGGAAEETGEGEDLQHGGRGVPPRPGPTLQRASMRGQ